MQYGIVAVVFVVGCVVSYFVGQKSGAKINAQVKAEIVAMEQSSVAFVRDAAARLRAHI